MRLIGILALVVLRPVRLLHGSFALLAVGIAWNALFLQNGPHPSPLFREPATVADDDVAQPSPAAPPVDAAVAPTHVLRDDLVFALQAALQGRGFYAGVVDGIAGPQTTAAIEAYQREAGQAATGKPSMELLAELGAEPREEEGDAAPDAQQAEPDPQLMAVQVALSRSAYGPLPADGLMGPQTHDAIARFQSDHDLPVTGEYSESLILDLRAIGAIETE